MDNAANLRRAMMLFGFLILVKIIEYVLVTPELEALVSSTDLYMKIPRVQHPRCDACRAVSGLLGKQ